VTEWLRRLCRLWIARIEALLQGRDVDAIERTIADVEWFLTNALTAHVFLNRVRSGDAASTVHRAALAGVERDADELLALLRAGRLSAEWTEPLRVERRYREQRDQTLAARRFYESRICLPKNDEIIIDVPHFSDAAIVDILVPPDIDRPGKDMPRPPEMPPPTLYLGSVTGMTPIECYFTGVGETLVHTRRLLKGWSEIAIAEESPVRRIRLTSHVHLFQPITIAISLVSPRRVAGTVLASRA
jgi:hypothetical protein